MPRKVDRIHRKGKTLESSLQEELGRGVCVLGVCGRRTNGPSKMSMSEFLEAVNMLHGKGELRLQLELRLLISWIGEGDGTPLQYSCLENPMDGGAW